MTRRALLVGMALLACACGGSSYWDGWPRPAPLACDAGGGDCRGRCVDLQNDASNCGACGRSCAAGERCALGACACPGAAARCGTSSCVNLLTARTHCGACGNVCGTGQTCLAGACSCAVGQLLCGGRCVDPRVDVGSCGACGRACATNERCVWGECLPRCAAGTGTCSPAAACAVALATSPEDCGRCGRRCLAGATCQQGDCVCPAGGCSGPVRPSPTGGLCASGDAARCPSGRNATPVCGGDGRCAIRCAAGFDRCDAADAAGCSAALDAADRCGGCGVACGPGEHCAWLACACPPGQARCGSACVDLRDDAAHCGACGAACEAGEGCADGRCVARGAPRLLWPPSGAVVVGRRPTLRWLPRRGEPGGRVELCADRGCSRAVAAWDAASGAAAPAADLAPGVVFWRVVSGGASSATWSFRVAARRAAGGVVVGGSVDVNGDGYADHLRLDASAARVCLLAGSPSGLRAGVCRAMSFVAGAEQRLTGQLAPGDFDGDGFTDVAVLPQGAVSPARVVVLRGGPGGLTPGGSFGERTDEWRVTATGPTLHGVGDVDGDGYADIAFSSAGRGAPVIAFHAGGPEGVRWLPRHVLSAPVGVRTLHGVTAVNVGDLDQDGGVDLLVVSQNDANGYRVLRYDLGASPFPALPTWNADLSVRAVPPVAAGDFDGDGRVEVMARNLTEVRSLRPELPPPLALVLPSTEALVAQGSFDGARDLDGDGRPDLLTLRTNPSPRGLRQYRLGPSPTLWRESTVDAAATGAPLWLGDVNGDGFDDVGVPSTTDLLVYHGASGGFPQFPSQRVPLRGPFD